ncbi:CDP-alcohol phosphatidyltransferase family protein [Phytohabitans sp. ZYX-F-186]|uniref:CDP-alcohol phosphatidyltransferase family protein n=1 Tax=Phytohabitans maris TaxID=3071409 RepID=A0ABU0ZFQ7_9ACTN|nr:CDP-alcohol phosphatidyltransferase family protein [Phytohabitans sp. ZYX-F-186]MDQ7905898.1 CDP-alcohol phosphatidyltransferase family protein [Phytohabitans sp. ZYX-F-186]
MGQGRLGWDEYATGWARLHGGFDPRKAGRLVRGWLRVSYVIGRGLARVRIPPAAVTFAGLLLCVSVPLLADRPALAAVFVLLAAMADSADGATAVVSGRATRLGYLYDSLADRLGEAAWLVAFWLVGAPGMLVVAAAGLSWLHEYVRARVVAAGMRDIGAVTVGERPTRVAVAFLGLLLAGAAEAVQTDLPAGTITVVAAVWVLLALVGLLQLLAAVHRVLR